MLSPYMLNTLATGMAVLAGGWGLLVKRRVFWVTLGLAISLVADYFMSYQGRGTHYFLLGVGWFTLAHGCFILQCWTAKSWNWHRFLPVLAGYLIFYFGWLFGHLPDTAIKIAALGYLLFSVVSLEAACGQFFTGKNWSSLMFLLGILLLVFSDTMIALRTFMNISACGPWILPTYRLCHLFLGISIVLSKNRENKRQNI